MAGAKVMRAEDSGGCGWVSALGMDGWMEGRRGWRVEGGWKSGGARVKERGRGGRKKRGKGEGRGDRGGIDKVNQAGGLRVSLPLPESSRAGSLGM